MPRTTISLPQDLKDRMDAVPDDAGISWSKEAQNCFEKVLGRLAEQKAERSMEDVIARLRASKIEWMEQSSENYDDGLASGREWAANIASYDDLYLLTMQLTMNVGEEHLENAPTGSAKRLALEVSVKDPEKIGELDLDAIAEQFWQPFGGLAAVDARGSAWLDAFEEGAKRLFNEIEDKL